MAVKRGPLDSRGISDVSPVAGGPALLGLPASVPDRSVTTMQQERLFALAPEVMHLGATFVGGKGWHLTVVMRVQDEQWVDAYRAEYDHLTTAELADVICEEASRLLRIL